MAKTRLGGYLRPSLDLPYEEGSLSADDFVQGFKFEMKGSQYWETCIVSRCYGNTIEASRLNGKVIGVVTKKQQQDIIDRGLIRAVGSKTYTVDPDELYLTVKEKLTTSKPQPKEHVPSYIGKENKLPENEEFRYRLKEWSDKQDYRSPLVKFLSPRKETPIKYEEPKINETQCPDCNSLILFITEPHCAICEARQLRAET